MITAYLGPDGSYSHVAAIRMTPQATHKPCKSFAKVFSAVLSGEADCAVIPIENTLNGGIAQNIDLLQSADGLCAVEELAVKIDHRLITLAGADVKNIRRVYSHAQALEQCARYLSESLPEAELIAVTSTAAGQTMIKTPADAGIVGAHTVAEGFTLSDKNIADESENFTQFLLVKRGEAVKNAPSRKIYFSVTCKNCAGALLKLLQPVYANGLNMTKLHSRPVKGCVSEYRFFIEAEGDYSSEAVQRAVEEVKRAANSFKLLGCY